MSRLVKPAHLTPDYELKGPEGLYITGPLRDAGRAAQARDAIREVAGPNSNFWPLMDDSLSFLADVSNPMANAVRQIRDEDKARVARQFGISREIVLVNSGRNIDNPWAFYLGRAVASEQIQAVYYLGTPRSLGDLTDAVSGHEKFTVIDSPLDVFRWEAPGGFAVRATMGSIK